MSDDEREDRLARAAGLRRTVAETIARVRRKTAHIGTSLPPADDEEPAEGEGAGREPEPEAADSAPSVVGEGAAGEEDTDRSKEEDRGEVGDVGALLERTRAIIERTRRMLDESRATVTRFHRAGRDESEADDESGEEDERGGSAPT